MYEFGLLVIPHWKRSELLVTSLSHKRGENQGIDKVQTPPPSNKYELKRGERRQRRIGLYSRACRSLLHFYCLQYSG